MFHIPETVKQMGDITGDTLLTHRILGNLLSCTHPSTSAGDSELFHIQMIVIVRLELQTKVREDFIITEKLGCR